MSDILETYQEEEEIKVADEESICYATVVSDSDNGLEVKFDGEENASTKKFAKNKASIFNDGDRVMMMKVEGTYIAVAPVALDGGLKVFNTSSNGLVPKSTDNSKFLKGDGTWADPSSGGGGSLSVSYYIETYNIGSVSANSAKRTTLRDNAPSGYYHMGICGCCTNSDYVIASAGLTSMGDTSCSGYINIANPTSSSRSGIYVYVAYRYLKLST